jgi:hypothetical protein
MQQVGRRPEMASAKRLRGFTAIGMSKGAICHARRLDTIALRLMVLLAVNDLKESR